MIRSRLHAGRVKYHLLEADDLRATAAAHRRPCRGGSGGHSQSGSHSRAVLDADLQVDLAAHEQGALGGSRCSCGFVHAVDIVASLGLTCL